MMTLEKIIKCHEDLTPTENQLAQYILENREEVQNLTLHRLAEQTYTSKSAIHRFCKKIGLNGFNELKVKVAQDLVEEYKTGTQIDVNFPFTAHDTQRVIAEKLLKLYEASITDTYHSINIEELNRCVTLLHDAEVIDIYTQAHNLNVAENFQDKMRSIGRSVNCPKSSYEQRCIAISSKKNHVAIILSYSGRARFLLPIVELLNKKQVEVILIGRLGNSRVQNNIKYHLYISDKENLRNRISQFSSHIAMQYILDVIFSCIFKQDYQMNIEYIQEVTRFIDNRNIDEEE